jgi:hypothetical protein
MLTRIIARAAPLFVLAVILPAQAAAQERARTAVEVRLLGGYFRPGLSELSDAFAGYRDAETAGAVLGSDASLRRSIASSIDGDDGFGGGAGGALEIGVSRRFGNAHQRRAGIGVQLRYDRAGAGYVTNSTAGSGRRDETVELAQAALVPRLSFVGSAATASVGVTAGVGRLRYRNESRTQLVSSSGRVAEPSGGFSGDKAVWSAGVFGELERSLTGRVSVLGRVGYEYLPPVDLAISGSDIDAAYRNAVTTPYPRQLGFPTAEGVLSDRPASIDLSGFRVHLGINIRPRW